MPRRSGILLPIASLPSRYGIGDFGPAAYRFVDWLAAAGQRVWEVLPLLITDSVGSPFDAPSLFALNWMLISPDALAERTLLSPAVAARYRRTSARIVYPRVNVSKRAIIGHAWATFQKCATARERERFADFRRTERWWLDNYTLFMAIKDRHGGRPWWTWPKPLRDRQSSALRRWANTHKDETTYFAFGQWLAHEQWRALKRYANKKGIRIIGDLPFFLVHDSVDVWVHRPYFQLDRHGRITEQAGAPPDLFYHRGQLWGNPLYHWPAVEHDGFRWMLRRIRKALALHDELRFDHFRGYVAVWSIKKTPKVDASRGRWIATPGNELLKRIRHQFPRARFYSEDLGTITHDVYQLRDRWKFFGMRVLQFGFHPKLLHLHAPATYPERTIAYSSTHDMPTLRSWIGFASNEERAQMKQALRSNERHGVWPLLRLLLKSKSVVTMMPLQDVLGLGPESRLNRPGRVDDRNWTWRLSPHSLTKQLAKKLRTVTLQSRR